MSRFSFRASDFPELCFAMRNRSMRAMSHAKTTSYSSNRARGLFFFFSRFIFSRVQRGILFFSLFLLRSRARGPLPTSQYFFRFPRWLQDATRPVGIQSRMAFYKCKFLIKVGVGLQIRKEAKFPQSRRFLPAEERERWVRRKGQSGTGVERRPRGCERERKRE